MTKPFPFSAIVGQDEVKLSLLIAAVDPEIGGVLVLGDRGTGKSTAVRGFASLLPQIECVAECDYHIELKDAASCRCTSCSQLAGKKPASIKRPVPVVDLPLGATEDRVVGAFDVEHALSTGEKRFQPGLLAEAHRGFLYIDEVNLLDDHIVDVLLDVSASGVNVVERDALSIRHPARFVIIGSGNPEEGELRPQLLDRFGLSVEVTTPTDLEDRMTVVKRRDEFDQDPEGFSAKWQSEDQRTQRRVLQAQNALHKLEITDDIRRAVSELCVALETDGLRGDLTLLRAARALAALNGATQIERSHLSHVAGMALRHRLRRDPLDESGSSARVERVVAKLFNANAA